MRTYMYKHPRVQRAILAVSLCAAAFIIASVSASSSSSLSPRSQPKHQQRNQHQRQQQQLHRLPGPPSGNGVPTLGLQFSGDYKTDPALEWVRMVERVSGSTINIEQSSFEGVTRQAFDAMSSRDLCRALHGFFVQFIGDRMQTDAFGQTQAMRHAISSAKTRGSVPMATLGRRLEVLFDAVPVDGGSPPTTTYVILQAAGEFMSSCWKWHRRELAKQTRTKVPLVSIVGAGPMGVVTAAILALEGQPSTVFEQRRMLNVDPDKPNAFQRDQVLRLDRLMTINMWLNFPTVMSELFIGDNASGVLVPFFAQGMHIRPGTSTRGVAGSLGSITAGAHIRINVFAHKLFTFIRAHNEHTVAVTFHDCTLVNSFDEKTGVLAYGPSTKCPGGGGGSGGGGSGGAQSSTSTVKQVSSKSTSPTPPHPGVSGTMLPDVVIGAAGSRADPVRAGIGAKVVKVGPEPVMWGLASLYSAEGLIEPIPAAAFPGRSSKFDNCERATVTSVQLAKCAREGPLRELVTREFYNYGYAPLKLGKIVYWGVGFNPTQMERLGLMDVGAENPPKSPLGDAAAHSVDDFMQSVIIPFEFDTPGTAPTQMVRNALFPSYVGIEIKSTSVVQKLMGIGGRRVLALVEGDARGTANYLRASGMNHALRSLYPPTPSGTNPLGNANLQSYAPSLTDMVWAMRGVSNRHINGNDFKRVVDARATYSRYLVEHLASSGRSCVKYMAMEDTERNTPTDDRLSACYPQIVGAGATDYLQWLLFLHEQGSIRVPEVCGAFVAANAARTGSYGYNLVNATVVALEELCTSSNQRGVESGLVHAPIQTHRRTPERDAMDSVFNEAEKQLLQDKPTTASALRGAFANIASALDRIRGRDWGISTATCTADLTKFVDGLKKSQTKQGMSDWDNVAAQRSRMLQKCSSSFLEYRSHATFTRAISRMRAL